MSDFSVMLESFFTKYLSVDRGCSINTRLNYRDSFVLLLEYLASVQGKQPAQVSMESFDYNMIANFLDWTEQTKGVSVSTRNNRLAGIKSFFRYVSMHEPQYLNRCNAILEIKAKRAESTSMNYLTITAFKFFLDKFNLDKTAELRDYCIVCTLYETGARVSELTDIKLDDMKFERPYVAVLHGKGGKSRVTPLSEELVGLLKKYITTYKISADDYLFMNARREKLTRRGIDYIVQKHFKSAKSVRPEIFPEKISPHSIRHSRAMHLLEKGVNLIYIRDLLGHSSVTTTEIYAKANPEIKRKHIESVTKNIIDHDDYDAQKKEDLLNWLRNNL